MADQITKLNYLKIAPRKVRLIAGLIKNLSVNDAIAQLLVERRRAARAILKLLHSGVANAKNNKHLNPDKLVIKEIRVDQGPMLKRYLPRARGMATPIQKKMSHITLILSESEKIRLPRFKIEVKKKIKLPEGGTKKPQKTKSKEKEVVETKKVAPHKKSSVLQRIFRRKANPGQ